MTYGGGTLSLLLRFFFPRRNPERCPICGVYASEIETNAMRMSPAMKVAHYEAQHKEYYDWLVSWTARLLISYVVLFVGLAILVIPDGHVTALGLLGLAFLVLAGFVVYRSNSIRHEKIFASNWAEQHAPRI